MYVLKLEELNNLFIDSSFFNSHAPYNQPKTFCVLKIFLATAGKISLRELSTMHLPLLDMISAEVRTTSSVFTTKISRNIRTFANTFANDYHFMSVAANLPTIIPATIIDMLNCSWLKVILD